MSPDEETADEETLETLAGDPPLGLSASTLIESLKRPVVIVTAIGAVLIVLGFCVLPVSSASDATLYVGYARVIFLPTRPGESLLSVLLHLDALLTTVHRLAIFIFAVGAVLCVVAVTTFAALKRWGAASIALGLGALSCALDGAIMWGEHSRVVRANLSQSQNIVGSGPWVAALGFALCAVAITGRRIYRDKRLALVITLLAAVVIVVSVLISYVPADIAPSGAPPPPG